MRKSNFVFIITLFLLSFVSAEINIGVDNSNSPKVFFPASTATTITNGSSLNVNNSEYWQGYTPTSYITAVLNGEYIRRDGGNSPTANINWNYFGIFNVGDSNFTNDVFIDNELTLGTGGSNLEISFDGTTNLFNTTGKNALFVDNVTMQNIIAKNICYSNGTGCSAQPANFTNVAYLNNTQTFTGINTFGNNLTISQGSRLVMYPIINIGALSNSVNGTRAIGIGGNSTTKTLLVSGLDAVGIGNGVTANNTNAVAIGINSISSASNSYSVFGNAKGQFCGAIGTGSQCLGVSSLALARNAVAQSQNCFSIGASTICNGTESGAIGGGGTGAGAKAYGVSSIVIGSGSTSGYKLGFFGGDDEIYPNVINNFVAGAESYIWNASNSVIVGSGNRIENSALGFILGKGNVLSENVTGGIIGNGLTNSINNSILMSTGVFNLAGELNVTQDITGQNNLFLIGLPTGSTGADTDYLCINNTSGEVFRNETGC